jgi:hypothetical protein
MADVKHGGCAICKSKDQAVLTSVLITGQIMGTAVCDSCKKNIKGEK